MPHREERPLAIVVGLDCLTGLQTARILHDRGIRVIGLAGDLDHYCSRTRVCERRFEVDTAGPDLVRWLLEFAEPLEAKPVLFPCTDTAVVAISRGRAELDRRYRIALPENEIVERLLDKSRFYRFAMEHGLPIPRTAFLESLDDCREAALRLSFPCALKPPVKTAAWTSLTSAKVFEVRDFEELLELYHRFGSVVDELILQEWIPGGDENLFTCYGYFDADSNPLVLYESHKLRQWPPNTGSGTLAELVQVGPAREATVDLVRCAGYHGLVFVQFKRHPQTGEYFIIEPNVGRPGLGMPIGEAGGAEILLTMYCDAAGLPLPKNRRVTRPAKWICWKRDLASALHSVRSGDLGVHEWLASLIGVRATADWRWTDPLPFVVDLLGSPTRLRRPGEPPAPRLQVRPVRSDRPKTLPRPVPPG